MSAADLSNFKSALRTKMNDSLLKRINDVEGMDILLSLFYRGCKISAVSQKQAVLLFPMHAHDGIIFGPERYAILIHLLFFLKFIIT